MSGVALDEEADRAAATEDLSFSPGGRPGSEITGSMDTTLFGRLPSLVQSGGGGKVNSWRLAEFSRFR